MFLAPRIAKGYVQGRPLGTGQVTKRVVFKAGISNAQREEERQRFARAGIDIDKPAKNPPSEIEKKIRTKGKEIGLTSSSIDRAVCIGKLESNLNTYAKSKSGTYKSLFQWNEKYWGRYSKGSIFDEDEQIRVSLERMQLGEWWRWPQTSKRCAKNG